MQHTILFTGHMIDAAGREKSRFPPQKENDVRAAIQLLLAEQHSTNKELTGIAGGACGGDIIFHEQCLELGIPTEIHLALPVGEYMKESVSFAGAGWEARFRRLAGRLTVYSLPVEGPNDEGRNVWERSNLSMLEKSLENGGAHMTLIAVWDGRGGDGKGGTSHMVKTAQQSGAETKIINVDSL